MFIWYILYLLINILILYFLFKIMMILAQVAQVGSSPDLAGAPERRYRGSTHVQVTSGASANRAAPHRSKNNVGVFSEHLRPPHVHLKECTGCASKLHLPQVQKQCKGFLRTLAPTRLPFQRVYGLLFKILPATDPKTRVSCEHFGAYHASISKSARRTGSKTVQGFSWKFAPTTRPFQRVHGFLPKKSPSYLDKMI